MSGGWKAPTNIQFVHVTDRRKMENEIKWPWVLATYVWNVERDEFADLYGRSHGYDPERMDFTWRASDRYGETGRWLAKTWALKEKDPLAWLSSLSAAQVDRIQTKIEETVYGKDFR